MPTSKAVLYVFVLDINECASNPCANKATCVDGVNLYRCTCVEGYTGTRCETGLFDLQMFIPYQPV